MVFESNSQIVFEQSLSYWVSRHRTCDFLLFYSVSSFSRLILYLIDSEWPSNCASMLHEFVTSE